MIRYVAYFLLAFIGLVAISFAEVELGTKIMAVVGDDVITYNDVQKRYNVIVATNNLEVTTDEEKHVLLRQVLQALINEKIFLQEAKKLKITATEQEINNVIANVEKQQNIPAGQFGAFLESKNITKADAITQITNSIIWDKILENIIAPKVQVSNAELNQHLESKYFKDYQVDLYLFTTGQTVEEKIELNKVFDKVKACSDVDTIKLKDNIKLVHIKKKVKDVQQDLFNKLSNINVGQKTPVFLVNKEAQFFILCNKDSGLSRNEIEKLKASIFDKKISLQTDYYMKNLSKKTFIEIYYK